MRSLNAGLVAEIMTTGNGTGTGTATNDATPGAHAALKSGAAPRSVGFLRPAQADTTPTPPAPPAGGSLPHHQDGQHTALPSPAVRQRGSSTVHGVSAPTPSTLQAAAAIPAASVPAPSLAPHPRAAHAARAATVAAHRGGERRVTTTGRRPHARQRLGMSAQQPRGSGGSRRARRMSGAGTGGSEDAAAASSRRALALGRGSPPTPPTPTVSPPNADTRRAGVGVTPVGRTAGAPTPGVVGAAPHHDHVPGAGHDSRCEACAQRRADLASASVRRGLRTRASRLRMRR